MSKIEEHMELEIAERKKLCAIKKKIEKLPESLSISEMEATGLWKEKALVMQTLAQLDRKLDALMEESA